MTRGSTRRLAVLVLGALLALGMGLPAVHASTMVAKMTVSSGMEHAGVMDCDSCVGAGDQGTQAKTCVPSCVGQVLAISPAGSSGTALDSRQPLLPPLALLPGRESAPDPHPPKATYLV